MTENNYIVGVADYDDPASIGNCLMPLDAPELIRARTLGVMSSRQQAALCG